MSQNNHPLLLIEDHSIYRAGLIAVISESVSACIHEASNVEKALEMDIDPEVIFLDIQLEGMSGIQGISQLMKRWPGAKIIMISANDSYVNTQSALDFGAKAFLSKSDTAENILKVFNNVLFGSDSDYILSSNLKNKISSAPKLSARQMDVLNLMAKGYSNKTIGKMLHISENTARWHVCAMNSILQVSSRTEAVFAARQLGLLP